MAETWHRIGEAAKKSLTQISPPCELAEPDMDHFYSHPIESLKSISESPQFCSMVFTLAKILVSEYDSSKFVSKVEFTTSGGYRDAVCSLLLKGIKRFLSDFKEGHVYFRSLLVLDYILTGASVIKPEPAPSVWSSYEIKPTKVHDPFTFKGGYTVEWIPRFLPILEDRSTDPDFLAMKWQLENRKFPEEDGPSFVGMTVVDIGFSSALAVRVVLVISDEVFDISSMIDIERPILTAKGHIGDVGTYTLEANKRLYWGLEPTHFFEKDERVRYLKEISLPIHHNVEKPLKHGSNISRSGAQERGSVGIFVRPASDAGVEYCLTAGHIAINAEDKRDQTGTTLQTLSGLDIHRHYAIVASEGNAVRTEFPKDKEAIIDSWNRVIKRKENRGIGDVTSYAIGVDADGWVEDWALVKMNDDWVGPNGSWCDVDAYEITTVFNMKKGSRIAKGLGPPTSVEGGEIVTKDGATTGITGGVVNGTSFYMYHRGDRFSKSSPPPLRPAKFSPSSKLELILSIGDKEFCRGGDSGAAVFGLREGCLGWCGILVGIGNLEDALNIPGGGGLMIPKSVMLKQMKDKTGIEWVASDRRHKT